MLEILNWSRDFENANTRKRQRLGWYLAPSGCDSRGCRLLMREGADGVLALGIFSALCQTMATLRLEVRKLGIFQHSNGDLMSVEDLAEITRIEADCFEVALPILEKAGWIRLILADDQQKSGRSPAGIGEVPIAQSGARNLPPSRQSPTGFVKGEGEGEGEGEGQAPADCRERSIPPSPSSFDWDFIRSALAEVFPSALVPMPKDEEKKIEELGEHFANLEPDDWEALMCWFRQATDLARGCGEKKRALWPRSRREFLENFVETVEKVREWWKAYGESWWKERVNRERRKKAKPVEESKEEELPEDWRAVLGVERMASK